MNDDSHFLRSLSCTHEGYYADRLVEIADAIERLCAERDQTLDRAVVAEDYAVSLREDRDRLRAQRDALLIALKWAQDALTSANLTDDSRNFVVAKINDAIKAAEGE